MGLGWSDFDPRSSDFGVGWDMGTLTGSGGAYRHSQFGAIDPNGDVARQAGHAGDFASGAQSDFWNRTRDMSKDRDYLRRLVSGQNSVSAEQLRQGLQQNLAAQRSMAASARPGMAPMAARTAAIQGARLGGGLAGQQALAGLQERNMAAQNLANLNLGQRGQDMSAALGSRQNALQGYLGLEQARTGRYGADMGSPSKGEMMISGLSSLGGLIGAGG